MTYNNYLPPEEGKLTTGVYKVSFEIHVESHDELSLSDITHDLSEGFERGFGEGFVNKVAELHIEQLTKKAIVKAVKIGDRVRLANDVSVTVDVYHDDGYTFIGKPNELSEKVTAAQVITLTAGLIGFVNKLNKDGSLEIADLDKPYVNETWADLGIDAVNVDLITVQAEHVEKIDAEESN